MGATQAEADAERSGPGCVVQPAPYSQVRLGIVCPMANEAASAARFVDAVLAECDRHPFAAVAFFAVVDLVSRDDTRAVLGELAAREARLRVVWAPETRGVADAYFRGYREAIAARCDWILEIDAGFSHSPADIGAFFEAMAEGRDCVFGSRFIAGGANLGSRRRRFVSRGGTILTNTLLGTRIADMTSGFELFSRPVLEDILKTGLLSHGPFFQTEIKAYCRNLRIAEVPIRYDAGNHHVGRNAIAESLLNLGRLFVRRLTGRL